MFTKNISAGTVFTRVCAIYILNIKYTPIYDLSSVVALQIEKPSKKCFSSKISRSILFDDDSPNSLITVNHPFVNSKRYHMARDEK